jgi:NADH-quinone oxidoreductase subunit N
VTAAGAFSVVAALERDAHKSLAPWDLDRFSGLAQRRPGTALAMTVFLMSLAGIPPAAGFVAKLYVFRAAVDADMTGAALIGVMTSVVGAYYYLRVVVHMYMKDEEATQTLAPSGLPLQAALWIAAVLVVVLGVGPGPLVELARASASTIGG